MNTNNENIEKSEDEKIDAEETKKPEVEIEPPKVEIEPPKVEIEEPKVEIKEPEVEESVEKLKGSEEELEEEEDEEEDEESEFEIYLEKFIDLKDLCKIIYDKSSTSNNMGHIKVYQLSNDKFCYYRLFVISEFFEERGAPVLSYAISDIEPKDFLFWNLTENELRMEEKGKKVVPFSGLLGKGVSRLFGLSNEIVFLIARVEKLPSIIEIALADTEDFK
ncbi:MAG: hypothetical protein ACFFDN_05495 [Candidatus Hodarchaeota archaeon]